MSSQAGDAAAVSRARTDQPRSRYHGILGNTNRVEQVSLWSVVVVLLGCTGLLVLGPHQDFWKLFEHGAATLAIVGLLLAFPALSYAASTEHLVIRTEQLTRFLVSRLSNEAKEIPAKTRELAAVSADVQEVGTEPPLTPAGALDMPGEANEPPSSSVGGTDEALSEAEEPPLTPAHASDDKLSSGDGVAEEPTSERAPAELLEPWIIGETTPADLPNALARSRLESVISGSAEPEIVRRALRETPVFALGYPAGDTSVPGQGTESDILHFTVEEDGRDRVMMPLFTSSEILAKARERNEDWQDLDVLEVSGAALLDDRDPDVTLVINPWSDSEFQLLAPLEEQQLSTTTTTTKVEPDNKPAISTIDRDRS